MYKTFIQVFEYIHAQKNIILPTKKFDSIFVFR